MPKLPDSVEDWLQVAEMDLVSATTLVRNEFVARMAGFHAQQAAEKLIKAVMADQNLDIPNSHKLAGLAQAVITMLPELADMETDLVWLSTFAVDMRYPLSPGLATTREHAERAIRIAEQIKKICRHYLKG